MAPGISYDKQLKMALQDHLRLRRKGDMVQLVWETKSSINKGKVYSDVLSEVNIRDIKNQKVGSIYNG